MFRKVAAMSVVGVAGYSGWVYSTRRSIRGINEFKPGSADEMLTETLRPGDIIMFQRDWSKYYLPKAISVACYQYLHGPGLDHCGMVAQNQQGELLIFELSPNGYTCTPYRDRIYKSHAESIVLIPLESSAYEQNSVQYRERIFQEVNRWVRKENQPYEPLELIKGCVSKIICDNSDKVPETVSKRWGQCRYPYSPSLRVVFELLHNATELVVEHEHGVSLEHTTPEDVFKRRLCIIANRAPVATSQVTSASPVTEATTKFGATTIIRDM